MQGNVGLVAKLAAVVAAGAVGLGLTGGNAGVVVGTSAVGAAVVVEHLGAARRRGAARHPNADLLGGADVVWPAERVGVGPSLRLRFAPATRKVWAPGVLGLSRDRVVFVPSDERRSDRVWTATPERVELASVAGRTTVVRVHAADRAGQFVVLAPKAQVGDALSPVIDVQDGLTDPLPGAATGLVPPPRPPRPMDPIPDLAAIDAEARRQFGPQGDQAVALVNQYGSAPHHREVERVRTALVFLAAGDLDELHRLVELADLDHRTVLSEFHIANR